MKLKQIRAFTLIELIITLILISVFAYISYSSTTAYYRYLEKREAQNLVDTLTDSVRLALSSSSFVDIKIIDNKTIKISDFFNKEFYNKIYKLPNNMSFYICSKHKAEYRIYHNMAPSLGGAIHIKGQYNNYSIIFPVAIARFRLEVTGDDICK